MSTVQSPQWYVVLNTTVITVSGKCNHVSRSKHVKYLLKLQTRKPGYTCPISIY